MSMSDDQNLVREMCNGNPAALRSIYERHKEDLLAVAVCLLSNVAAGEDALHDAFVAFAGAAPGLRLRGSLRSYLVACVANRARDQLRRKRGNTVALSEAGELAGPEADPADAIVAAEETEALVAALALLPYEQREVITLHLHGGMTFKEVARQQNVSLNTAMSRYRYGLDKLRSLLNAGART
jgi:RNA polymerase sigma-70 factor (ECF subfamily)